MKWTAMLLTEPVEQLRGGKVEGNRPIRKQVEERQLAEWYDLMTEAMDGTKQLEVTYW